MGGGSGRRYVPKSGTSARMMESSAPSMSSSVAAKIDPTLASVLIPSEYQNHPASMLKELGNTLQLVRSVSAVARKPSDATVARDLGSRAAAGRGRRPQ